MELGEIGADTGSALLAAALLSVLIFPVAALTVLGRERAHAPDAGEALRSPAIEPGAAVPDRR